MQRLSMQASLLTCWLGFSQVGLGPFPALTHWVTSTNFTDLRPFPRFRACLAARSGLVISCPSAGRRIRGANRPLRRPHSTGGKGTRHYCAPSLAVSALSASLRTLGSGSSRAPRRTGRTEAGPGTHDLRRVEEGLDIKRSPRGSVARGCHPEQDHPDCLAGRDMLCH